VLLSENKYDDDDDHSQRGFWIQVLLYSLHPRGTRVSQWSLQTFMECWTQMQLTTVSVEHSHSPLQLGKLTKMVWIRSWLGDRCFRHFATRAVCSILNTGWNCYVGDVR